MNQSNIIRTLIFSGVAVLLLLITWRTSPGPVEQSSENMVNKQLFPDFKDPFSAVSLEVVTYNEELAESTPFKVAKVDGRWVIPSHEDYPADAEDQLADVASSLMDLVVLQTPVEIDGVLDIQALHETYGVLDPTDESVAGAEHVGTRVVMEDVDGESLLELIVGNEVPDQRDQRYVRRVGEDAVFVVALRADKISARFEDWIEDDLLKLSSWDIKQLFIDDYSVDILQGRLETRGRMRLEYDDTGDPKWKMLLDEALDTDVGQLIPLELAEDEELNEETLNSLKSAVDALTIVDVARKPEGLSANLEASGSFDRDSRGAQSLAGKGFYLTRNPGSGGLELRSTEGEIHVSMKSGVQYVLRFGKSTTLGTNETADESDGDSSADTENADGEPETTPAGLNRYMFVMAQLDESVIPLPDLLDPPTPPAAVPPTTPDVPPPTDPGALLPPTGPGTTPPTAPDVVPPAEAGTTEPAPIEPTEPTDGTFLGDGAQTSAPFEAEPQPPVVEPPVMPPHGHGMDSHSHQPPGLGMPGEEHSFPGGMPPLSEDPVVNYESELERVETHNKREQEEYDKKLTEAREKVDKLNARFADWYYIISDETYQKIHLGRSDIVQVKEPEESETSEMPDFGAMPPPTESPFVETSDGASMEDFEALKANPPGGDE